MEAASTWVGLASTAFLVLAGLLAIVVVRGIVARQEAPYKEQNPIAPNPYASFGATSPTRPPPGQW